jgi:hypothetical protein
LCSATLHLAANASFGSARSSCVDGFRKGLTESYISISNASSEISRLARPKASPDVDDFEMTLDVFVTRDSGLESLLLSRKSSCSHRLCKYGDMRSVFGDFVSNGIFEPKMFLDIKRCQNQSLYSGLSM